MKKIGKFLFKNRGILPVPVLLVALFYPAYNMTTLTFITGIALILLGEAGRFWSVSYAGGITRTRTGDLSELIVAGPFAYVKNPIYISNIIMYSGATVIMGVPMMLPFVILYFFIEYSFIIIYEESILLETFGEKYSTYKVSIRKWLPMVTDIQRSSHLPSWKEALVSERSTFNSIVGIVLIAVAKYFFWHL